MFNFLKAARGRDVDAGSQRELTAAFHPIGINFMQLNPVIRDALIREAILNGAEAAAAEFIALSIQASVSHLIAIGALPPSDGALRHGEDTVFEPDLSALVRRTGKARDRLRNIRCPEAMFGAPWPVITVSGSEKNSVCSTT